jgi:hypothetical protein
VKEGQVRPLFRVSFAVAAICVAGLPGAQWGQGFGACGRNICASSGAAVGLGTTSPTIALDVRLTDPSYGVQVGMAQGSNYLTFFASSSYGPAIYWDPGFDLRFGKGGSGVYNATGFTEQMRIQSSTGNVGIGTTNPQHLLHVAGTIGAEEVIVSSTGADYVFQPDYHLLPLQDVAKFIRENHHLPEIPSEAEVKEKGVSLGEMQAKLLANIEELT